MQNFLFLGFPHPALNGPVKSRYGAFMRRCSMKTKGLGQNLNEPPSDSTTGRRSGRAERRQFAFSLGT